MSTAEINEDLESDDVDVSAAVTSPSKRPKVDGEGDGELDIIGVASSNGNLLRWCFHVFPIFLLDL